MPCCTYLHSIGFGFGLCELLECLPCRDLELPGSEFIQNLSICIFSSLYKKDVNLVIYSPFFLLK